jgi:hypothetical protein
LTVTNRWNGFAGNFGVAMADRFLCNGLPAQAIRAAGRWSKRNSDRSRSGGLLTELYGKAKEIFAA